MKIIAITPNLKTDYLAETVIDGLMWHGCEIIASDLGNGINTAYTDDEILVHSRDADYIFVIWGKVRGNKPPKYYLLDAIKRPEITVYIDGSEWTSSGNPNPGQTYNAQILKNHKARKGNPWINNGMLSYCSKYFKRECYPEDLKLGIQPLLFGANRSFFPKDQSKTIDLFCAFGQSKDGLRKEAISVSQEIQKMGYNVVIANNLSEADYRDTLSRSRVTIDAWGGGDCCKRLWENLAAKTCCLMQDYNIVFPDGFTDGLNILKYKSEEELRRKLIWAVTNKSESLEIAKKSYDHLLKYHTSLKRVEYIFKKLNVSQ